MGLTTREMQESALLVREPPHYYEVKDENGDKYCHCGTIRDVEESIQRNPTFTYEKVYLPNVRNPTVNVKAETVVDPELNQQNILPDRQQEPLDL